MKKYIFLSLLLTILSTAPVSWAQDDSEIEPEEEAVEVVPAPRIETQEAVEIGRKVILDATDSDYDPEQAQFTWDLGDGNKSSEGPDIVHTYNEIGEFEITLTLRQGEEEFVTKETIFVFDTKAILITDSDFIEKNSELINQAKANGVFLKIVTAAEEGSTLLQEEAFLQKIQEERDSLADANILIFATSSSVGIQSFTRFWQSLEDERKFPTEDKLWVRITERTMAVSAATLQQSFKVIQPEYFLLTRPEALNPIFEQREFASIQETLQTRGIEYQVINERSGPSPLLLLTATITSFLEQGIPASTIFLVLSFPFIAFFVAFSRQIVGLSTYGVFLPILLALSFQILTLPFSLLVLVVILSFSFMLRIFFAKLDIPYVPRAALMLSTIALSFLSVIWFALRFGSPVSITLAIFPMMVMTTISEKFLSAQSEEGFMGALLGALETILVAIVSFALINFTFFKELLLSFPELIVLPLLAIFLLGRFTGLRLSEYFRFRTLLQEGMEEE